jgi:inhibitor of KinA
VLVDICDKLDLAVNVHIQQLAKAIKLRQPGWIRDVVPALGSLAVHVTRGAMKGASPTALVRALVDECLAEGLPDLDALVRTVELPVCYDAEFGLDIEEVAAWCNVSVREVADLHAGASHRVLMVGFVPGHPYIGGLDAKLSVPRRATPRQRVKTGSIAIANAQTVVYPFDSPSGWSIIGRTSEQIFDPSRLPPALFSPGDRVRFVQITRQEFDLRVRGQRA